LGIGLGKGMDRFAGRVVIVTGASSGIGAATAEAFAREGAAVGLAARRQKEGQAVADRINTSGGRAIFVRTDVSDCAQVENLVEATVSEFGRLDFGVNNAGSEGARAPTGEYPLDEWDRVFGVNLTGVFLCMKYQIPHILDDNSGGGAIVNVASGNGLVGGAGVPGYIASKHAAVGLTKSAALEYAPLGLRINALCTSSVATPMQDRIFGGDAPEIMAKVADMHPSGTISTSEECAGAIMWLCSGAASYVTGYSYVMDGGWLAR